MNQEFSVGEWVERKFDNKVGVVKKAEIYGDTWTYYVQFDVRDPEDIWGGSPGAWRRHHNVHAHVDKDSRDCDGRYTSGYSVEMTLQERCEAWGDTVFKARVMTDIVNWDGNGLLDISPEGLSWSEATEEGHRAIEVRWCQNDECKEEKWQRDHSAEAAGY